MQGNMWDWRFRKQLLDEMKGGVYRIVRCDDSLGEWDVVVTSTAWRMGKMAHRSAMLYLQDRGVDIEERTRQAEHLN
jgi:hypothetical protein